MYATASATTLVGSEAACTEILISAGPPSLPRAEEDGDGIQTSRMMAKGKAEYLACGHARRRSLMISRSWHVARSAGRTRALPHHRLIGALRHVAVRGPLRRTLAYRGGRSGEASRTHRWLVLPRMLVVAGSIYEAVQGRKAGRAPARLEGPRPRAKAKAKLRQREPW